MKFSPQTNLQIFKDIPLDINHHNVYRPHNLNNIDNIFTGKLLYTFNDFSYQREEQRVRVPINADKIYHANYLRYQNNNYSNKWFYAFITKVEYANENVSFVYFQIDQYMTWVDNINFQSGFVERCHVEDDTPGKYIVPEGNYGGPIITTGQIIPFNLSLMGICVSIAFNSEQNQINVVGSVGADTVSYVIPVIEKKFAGGGIVNNVYSGCKYLVWKTSQVENLNEFFKTLMDKGQIEMVTGINMIPWAFMPPGTTGNGEEIYQEDGVHIDYNVDNPINVFGTLDGYVPRNKKLLTQEFNYITINDMNGGSQDYYLENFVDNTMKLRLQVNFGPNPAARLVTNYLQTLKFQPQTDKENKAIIEGNLNYNYDYPVTIDSWPLCSFAYSAYQNYLAQTQNRREAKIQNTIMQTLFSLVTSIFVQNPFQAASTTMNAIEEVSTNYATYRDMIRLSNNVNGNAGMGNVNIAHEINTFVIEHKTITSSWAKKLDFYFDMFGYKVEEIKDITPLLTNRPNWNYLKCANVQIYGDLPVESKQEIESMLLNGVTFWHNTDIGNYNLNNQVSV